MAVYAKIDPTQNPNVVVDLQILQNTDPMDPNFTWVDITGMSPQPDIGWTYNGTTFTQPGLPNDAYGLSVTFSTDGTTDTYRNQIGMVAAVPHGTPQAVAYLELAIQDNLANLAGIAEGFVQSRYDDSTRLNLMGLVLNEINGFLLSGILAAYPHPNRMAYLTPLLTWQNSILAYLAAYVANVKAQTTAAAVAAISPSFTAFVSSDPLLSPLAAIAIPN